MNKFVFWYDEREKEYKRIGIYELVKILKENYREGLRIKENLYYYNNKSIKMTAVINTKNNSKKGFRRYSCGGNETNKYRGSHESLVHSVNKEVIANLNEIKIDVSGKLVKLFIKEIIPEETVICNGRTYRTDLKIILTKTEPEFYFEIFSGEIYFEICHTCKVDSLQAEDFAIEGKTLYEYIIPSYIKIPDNIATEEYEKKIDYLTKKYNKMGIKGILICEKYFLSDYGIKRNAKTGNLVIWNENDCITISKDKFSKKGYVFCLDNKWYKEYNGRKFFTEEDAIRNANFMLFEKRNKNL